MDSITPIEPDIEIAEQTMIVWDATKTLEEKKVANETAIKIATKIYGPQIQEVYRGKFEDDGFRKSFKGME